MMKGIKNLWRLAYFLVECKASINIDGLTGYVVSGREINHYYIVFCIYLESIGNSFIIIDYRLRFNRQINGLLCTNQRTA